MMSLGKKRKYEKVDELFWAVEKIKTCPSQKTELTKSKKKADKLFSSTRTNKFMILTLKT